MKEKSSSSFRLDEQVYLTMAAVALVSLLIFGFRFITRHPCSPIILHIEAVSFEKGNIISFKAVTTDAKNFTWDFGDGTTAESTDPTARHKYNNAGKYTTSVTADGECAEFQNLVITEAPVVANLNILPMFTGPDTAYVNQPATYEDISIKASNWEWHFEDDIKIDAITKSASHIYKTPGTKKISLMVDGRRDRVASKYVFVIDREAEKNLAAKAKSENHQKPEVKIITIPAKPTAEPLTNPTTQPENNNPPKREEEKPKPKAPEVTGPQMEALLMDVVEGKKVAADFSGYLCNNLSMFIVYNSNSVTFTAMCENLKGLKKKKVKKISVKLVKDGATNCISSMIVIVDVKKGFLGL